MKKNEIQFDMMELADLGQPTKIAFELHKQLRAQLGKVPLQMPLEDVARAVGIAGIKEFDTEDFEGTLVIQNGVGAIGLRRGLRQGRRNFTIGHEIGHFLIPNHRLNRSRFDCKTQDISKLRGSAGNWAARPEQERIEVEANEFAAAFLVPMPEYREIRLKLGNACDVSHVKYLAETFAVSQEMMAKIYVNSADERAAIILSQNGVVRRTITQSGFPYLGLKSGSLIPQQAISRHFKPQAGGKNISDLREVQPHIWLEDSKKVSAIYEQVFLQGNGWASTLLLVDEDEQDDEEDDRNWNRRSGRR